MSTRAARRACGESLAERVLYIESLRQEVAGLKRARARLGCDGDSKPTGWEDGGPCWKQWELTGGPDGGSCYRVPQEQWCESCRERESVHLTLRKMAERLRIERAVLTRAAARELARKREGVPGDR